MTHAAVGTVRRPGREIPQFQRRVVNVLIDQGWRYEPPAGGGHFKVIPPDPTKPMVVSGSTPSDYKGRLNWITNLRTSGAKINSHGDSVVARKRRAPVQHDELVAVESSIQPILTVGAWWRPDTEEEPEPEPAPVVEAQPPRRYSQPPAMTHPRSSLDPDAQGTSWTLGQARTLIRQGYHLNKVIAKTGWGRNYLSDLVDESGYLNVASPY